MRHLTDSGRRAVDFAFALAIIGKPGDGENGGREFETRGSGVREKEMSATLLSFVRGSTASGGLAPTPHWLNGSYSGLNFALAALLFWLFLSPELGIMAHAEALPVTCDKTEAVYSWTPPPTGPIAFLLSFERRVSAAFPIGSEEKALKRWLNKQGFVFNGRDQLDTAFADEPEEQARLYARIKSWEFVNVSTMSWATICGRIVYSVGWDADECGLIDEIHADVEYCQFDLP